MLRSRLKKRCPSATFVGVAIAKNHVLEFSKKSKDGSGKATLVFDPSENVEGVLFRIKNTELKSLDSFEGAPKGYTRQDRFKVSNPKMKH
jgi:gamma-glutamylcyclotransferase